MKKLFYSIIMIVSINTLSFSQTTYDVINDLPAEFCDDFHINVVVWTCSNSCDYQSCYTVHQFTLSSGTSDYVTLNGSDWVGRVDYWGSCGTKSGYETCTTTTGTTCHIEYDGGCSYVAQPNVTVDANTTTQARIH